LVLGVVASALAWTRLRAVIPRGSDRGERLIGQWLLPFVAALVFVRYLPTLADWMSPAPQAKDYLAGPNFSWTIALLDLGLALPASVAVCVGYRSGAAWGRRGLYALTGWFAMVGTAVAGMAIAMQLRDDPAMTLPQMTLMVILGVLLLALAMTLYMGHGPRIRRRRKIVRPRPARITGRS
jgi:hypothetical protein